MHAEEVTGSEGMDAMTLASGSSGAVAVEADRGQAKGTGLSVEDFMGAVTLRPANTP